jgi:hypothetical protein
MSSSFLSEIFSLVNLVPFFLSRSISLFILSSFWEHSNIRFSVLSLFTLSLLNFSFLVVSSLFVFLSFSRSFRNLSTKPRSFSLYQISSLLLSCRKVLTSLNLASILPLFLLIFSSLTSRSCVYLLV